MTDGGKRSTRAVAKLRHDQRENGLPRVSAVSYGASVDMCGCPRRDTSARRGRNNKIKAQKGGGGGDVMEKLAYIWPR